MIRMPPRSTVIDVDGYGPMLDINSVLLRNASYNSNPDLGLGGFGVGLDFVEKSLSSSAVGHRRSISSSDKSLRKEAAAAVMPFGGDAPPPPPPPPLGQGSNTSRYFDITIYVGRNRAPFTVSSETLQGSAYFRTKIDSMRGEKFDLASSPVRPPSPPLVIDCEESVFQNVLCVLRYGSLEALPKLTDADLFRLKKELEFYGIEWPEHSVKNSSSSSKIMSTVSPKVNSPPPQPASTKPVLPATEAAAVTTPRNHHISVAELPDFPHVSEIGEPQKLILVRRTDDDPRARCSCCTPSDQQSTWALSFHYRHAFCTGCSKPSTNILSPKFLGEMFMAAAAFYSGELKFNNSNSKSKWSVGSDSTCTLKSLNARSCCTCLCSSSSSSSKQSTTVWLVSTYHSHAFCSQCGEHADGSTLICILLTVRYGGLHRSSSKSKKSFDQTSVVEISIGREAPKLQPAPSYKQRSSPEAQIPRTPRPS